MGETLADAILEEQKRCRDLLVQYARIGDKGKFGIHIIEQGLARMDQAIIGQDLPEMIAAYERIKTLK